MTARLLSAVIVAMFASGQSDTRQLQPLLSPAIQHSQVTEFQLRQYLMKRTKPVPVPSDGPKWIAEAKRIRSHRLDNVIFMAGQRNG